MRLQQDAKKSLTARTYFYFAVVVVVVVVFICTLCNTKPFSSIIMYYPYSEENTKKQKKNIMHEQGSTKNEVINNFDSDGDSPQVHRNQVRARVNADDHLIQAQWRRKTRETKHALVLVHGHRGNICTYIYIRIFGYFGTVSLSYIKSLN